MTLVLAMANKPTSINKEDRLSVRFTMEQKLQLEKAAAKLKKKPSEMVRDLVLQEIGRVGATT